MGIAQGPTVSVWYHKFNSSSSLAILIRLQTKILLVCLVWTKLTQTLKWNSYMYCVSSRHLPIHTLFSWLWSPDCSP